MIIMGIIIIILLILIFFSVERGVNNVYASNSTLNEIFRKVERIENNINEIEKVLSVIKDRLAVSKEEAEINAMRYSENLKNYKNPFADVNREAFFKLEDETAQKNKQVDK